MTPSKALREHTSKSWGEVKVGVTVSSTILGHYILEMATVFEILCILFIILVVMGH